MLKTFPLNIKNSEIDTLNFPIPRSFNGKITADLLEDYLRVAHPSIDPRETLEFLLSRRP